MKIRHSAAFSAAAIVLLYGSQPLLADPGNGNSSKEPIIPVGSLSAYPTLVQTGTHPTLNWEIQYPESVRDIVVIDPDGTITPKVDLCMEVRILGASFQLGSDGKGKPIWGTVQAEVRAGSDSGFNQIFNDTQDEVRPSQVYYSRPIMAGQTADFRSRCYAGGWYPWRSTEQSTPNVIALVNGDSVPSTVPAFNEGDIEFFLQPYIDAGGKISIGPKDVILLFELYSTNTTSRYFDLQDMVILASFDYCKNNNGNGNNIDSVDVSNPGQGSGGPNGSEDLSGEIDDEIIK